MSGKDKENPSVEIFHDGDILEVMEEMENMTEDEWEELKKKIIAETEKIL